MIQRIIVLLFLLQLQNAYAQKSIPLSIEASTFENEKGKKVEAELGSFEVPENRKKPDGKKLTIKFIRFKSTNPQPGAPIVYLAGGPGGSGSGTAKGSRFDLFMSMRAVADVIAFDQRGTGLSDGPGEYAGFWAADPSQALDASTMAPRIKAATLEAAAFFQKEGHDISAYNSNESADDINDLRIALGVEKVSLWSISYGTHLALATLKRHEAHLDKLILAGVEGYDHTVKRPEDQQVLLEKIDQLLKEDPKTAAVYPDFLGDVKRLLDQLEKSPALVKSKHPATGAPLDVVLGKLDMQILLAGYLRGPSLFKSLPKSVKAMLQGDFSSMAAYAFYPKYGGFMGMNLGMDIASGISPKRLHLLQQSAQNTLLGDAINYPYLVQREALNDWDLGAGYRTPHPSNIPVLCISGTLDGRTAPHNATETLLHLSNGKHLIIDGAGHSDPLFLSSPKIEQIMLDFLNGKTINNQTIVLPPIDWEL